MEIPPFSLRYTAKSPTVSGLSGYVRHTYNDAQTRVDEDLQEAPTTSWHRVDLGVTYRLKDVRLALEVNNLTDELYYQHMSYLRNPYSSGARLYEPGRTVYLNLVFEGGV